MRHQVLLEIGTEELPASFLRHALHAMDQAAKELFDAARLTTETTTVRVLGTPRRIAVEVCDVAERQSDRNELVVGPPVSAAFDAEGRPKKAAEGFAKKNGVAVDELTRVSTSKGEYVAARIVELGRPAEEVVGDVLSEVCRRITFPKSMRWGLGEIAFGRPIHWLVALCSERLLEVSFAGIDASRRTRGHRFLAPAEIELASAAEYEARLEQAHVIVDPSVRRRRMVRALEKAAGELGGRLVHDDFLVEECVSLVEEPFIVPGRFDDSFLALPEEVIVSVMRDHQRYFALRDAEGRLMPRYLNVVNTAQAEATIAHGNDRVLRARLADARFFVQEDRKRALGDRVPRLDGVVFQAKLGSMGAKVSRVEALAEHLASELSGVDRAQAAEAARLAKADLDTLIVGEFPELQGSMGRWYALEEGIDPEICDAIRDHHRPQGPDDELPVGPLGAVVAVADRIDTLVGCFGIGLKPTGSNDPFALRRAALGIVRIALEGRLDVRLGELVEHAYRLFAEGVLAEGVSVQAELDEFFRGRLRAHFRQEAAGDVVEACLLAWDGQSISELGARIEAVAAFRALSEFESLAVAFKRAHNIAKDGPRGACEESRIEPGAETDLFRCWREIGPKIAEATAKKHFDEALRLVATELRSPIDRFFDEVFVMVEDVDVRENRLRLLAEIADAVQAIAHLHVLSAPNA